MDEGNINSKIVRFNERLFLAYFAVAFGLHFDHVLGWWEQRDDPNILILTYEDRIKVRNKSKPFMDLKALVDVCYNPLFSLRIKVF